MRENIKGRSPSEVLLAVRNLFAARMSYLQALRDYDKAQPCGSSSWSAVSIVRGDG